MSAEVISDERLAFFLLEADARATYHGRIPTSPWSGGAATSAAVAEEGGA